MSRQLNFRDSYFSKPSGFRHRLPKPFNIDTQSGSENDPLFFGAMEEDIEASHTRFSDMKKV
jgi:hypothetical protein